MRNKKPLAIAGLALVLALFAAIPSLAAEPGDIPLVSIENGYTAGYSLSASDIGSSLDFAIAIGLSDKLQAKVAMMEGDGVFPSYRLFGLSYAVAPRLGFSTLFGLTGATKVVGLEMDVSLLSNVIAGSLQSGLKLKLDYIAPFADYDKGIIGFGLAASVGF